MPITSPKDLANKVASMMNPNSLGIDASIEAMVCNLCSEPALDFDGDLSIKEYLISAMCQRCQDDTFGAGEEGDLPF